MTYNAVLYNVTEKDATAGDGGGWDTSSWFGPKASLREKNPLLNLPYVRDGDALITQSNACMVYLGDKLGLMGDTAQDRIEIEQLLCECMDLRNAVG